MNRLLEHLTLRSDGGRALRTSLAFGLPLLICHALGLKQDAMFVAIAAQTVALTDLRGSYGMRLMIIAVTTVVIAASALLGHLTGHDVVAATLGMGLVALLGGCWRHLSADYGPGLSVVSALMFLIATTQPGSLQEGLHIVELVFIGGAGATFLHMILWPFRPQHPLRYAVAEGWVVASDMVAHMRPAGAAADRPHADRVAESERELRVTLDRTFVILTAARQHSVPEFHQHMEEMRVAVVEYSMRAITLHTSLEPLLQRPEFAASVPLVDSVFKALSDAARSVAFTLIMHRAENFAATQIRLERCQDLLRVLDDQLRVSSDDFPAAQTHAAIAQEQQALQRLLSLLGQTIQHAEASLRFPARLPELGHRPARSLAAWINPSAGVDSVLIRFTLRLAVLSMGALALARGLNLENGYWMAFTVVAVLQPDYGATLQRAGERTLGTLAGTLAGSGLLWIKMPLYLLDICAAAMAFGFAYFLKRKYGIAVFFVTLMLVLVTETVMVLDLDFTVHRMAWNLAGGVAALLSMILFWPQWEKEKFPSLLAAAVRANRAYLEALMRYLNDPQPGWDDLLMAKRRTENASRMAAGSLQRLLAEPGHHSDSAPALMTYNQRVTRAFTAIAILLQSQRPAADSCINQTAVEIGQTLDSLAGFIEKGASAATERAGWIQSVRQWRPTSPACEETEAGAGISQGQLVWNQLAKSSGEVKAMALALSRVNEWESSGEGAGTPVPAASS